MWFLASWAWCPGDGGGGLHAAGLGCLTAGGVLQRRAVYSHPSGTAACPQRIVGYFVAWRGIDPRTLARGRHAHLRESAHARANERASEGGREAGTVERACSQWREHEKERELVRECSSHRARPATQKKPIEGHGWPRRAPLFFNRPPSPDLHYVHLQ